MASIYCCSKRVVNARSVFQEHHLVEPSLSPAKFHKQTNKQTDGKQTDTHGYYTSLTLHAREVNAVPVAFSQCMNISDMRVLFIANCSYNIVRLLWGL